MKYEKFLNGKSLKSFLEKCSTAKSYAEMINYLGIPKNGSSYRKLKEFLRENNVALNSYVNNYKPLKYERVIKKCPICLSYFETVNGGTQERKTCGYSCANTMFRSGINSGNFSGKNYRIICFEEHEKKCIVKDCKEDESIDVHHVDENSKNNSVENLVPLCKNHHFHLHYGSRLASQSVRIQVKEYINYWKAKKSIGK